MVADVDADEAIIAQIPKQKIWKEHSLLYPQAQDKLHTSRGLGILSSKVL